MNEYQQALMRIIELEDKNAELLDGLEASEESLLQIQEAFSFYILGDTKASKMVKIARLATKDATRAIRKAKGE